jgi:hypothetical protein
VPITSLLVGDESLEDLDDALLPRGGAVKLAAHLDEAVVYSSEAFLNVCEMPVNPTETFLNLREALVHLFAQRVEARGGGPPEVAELAHELCNVAPPQSRARRTAS